MLITILVLVSFSLSANDAPQIFMEKADILDWQLEMFYSAKVSQAAKSELENRKHEFQQSWNLAVEQGILKKSQKVSGLSFKRREYTAWLSLAPLIPMGRPLIINVSPYLNNGSSGSPMSMNSFISMTHHEVLHFLVEIIEGKKLYNISNIAKKYKDEPSNVLAHLHLMAIQKAAYIEMGNTGLELLSETEKLYSEVIKGDYARAWQIVKEEGVEVFLKELNRLNIKH